MGHELKIDSDRAWQAATALSELTGESLAAAVTTALEERLERERRARDKAKLIDHLEQIARRIHASMDPGTTSDHAWLYDENGLPK